MEVESLLKQLGPRLLKSPWKEKWAVENPTSGYCYLVSEALFHYDTLRYRPYVLNLGEHGTHWFLVDQFGVTHDHTDAQFDFKIPRHKSRRQSFFKGKVKTERGYISQRGFEMAKWLKLI